MAQVFQVLKCFECETFQVQQRKKSNKWRCKMCNAKQSIIKVFGEGAAVDCRKHVQKLNMMKASKDRIIIPNQSNTAVCCVDNPSNIFRTGIEGQDAGIEEKKVSKWAVYAEPTAADDSTSDDGDSDGGRLVQHVALETELTQGKRRMRKTSSKPSKKSRLTSLKPVCATINRSSYCITPINHSTHTNTITAASRLTSSPRFTTSTLTTATTAPAEVQQVNDDDDNVCSSLQYTDDDDALSPAEQIVRRSVNTVVSSCTKTSNSHGPAVASSSKWSMFLPAVADDSSDDEDD